MKTTIHTKDKMKIRNSNLSTSEGSKILKEKIFTRRAFLIIIGQIFGYFVIFIRLIDLQIFKRKKYEIMSDNNQYKPDFIIPKRGAILDINNKTLAHDVIGHKIILSPKNFRHIKSIVPRILDLLDKKNQPTDIKRFIRHLNRKIKLTPHNSLTIWSSLTKKEISRIGYNLSSLPGISIVDHYNRLYVLGEKLAPILGYLRTITFGKHFNNRKAILKLSSQDYKEGNIGLEKTLNESLRGKLGLKIRKVNAVGSTLEETIHTKATNGTKIKTTIDLDLQSQAFDLIKDKEGSLSVINLETGGIIACASSPSFDSNLLSNMPDPESLEKTILQKNAFINNAFSIPCNPGSTFKIVSALDALIMGIDPKIKYFCTGKYKIGNKIFHCNKKEGHGYVNMVESIARSCNCYFYNLSTMCDVDRLHKTAQLLGLGHLYDISGLPNRKGIIPNRKWKKHHFNSKWFPGETANMVIGQGYTETTALQLMIMISRIATGSSINPQILANKIDSENIPTLDIKEEYLEIIREALFKVFDDREGTSRWFHTNNPLYQISGKTGTAQVISRRIENKDMNAGKIDKSIMPHGLFVGYFPSNNPKFAISIQIDHGRSGTRCIPLVKKLAKSTIDKYLT